MSFINRAVTTGSKVEGMARDAAAVWRVNKMMPRLEFGIKILSKSVVGARNDPQTRARQTVVDKLSQLNCRKLCRNVLVYVKFHL